MSIFYPTPGELTDRLTILALKRRAAASSTWKVNRLDDEIDAIKRVIEEMWGVTREEINRLGEVNRELWRLEDLIRTKGMDDVFYGRVARLITEENDKRGRVKASIDATRAIGHQDPRFYKK